jgi:hypothetical protein
MLTMKDVRHLMEKYHMTCHKVNKNRKKHPYYKFIRIHSYSMIYLYPIQILHEHVFFHLFFSQIHFTVIYIMASYY